MSRVEEPTDVSNGTDPVNPSQAVISSATLVEHKPYLALQFRDFRFLLTGTFMAVLGMQMLTIAIGWELYQRTHSALMLGLVGLVEVIPVFLFSLPAGHLADHSDRKRIIIIAQIFAIISALGLAVLSYTQGSILLIYGCILLMGIAGAFANPASTTLMVLIVPEEAYENAATWSSSSWQLASVVGPALGGFGIALFHGAMLIYVFNAVAGLIYLLLLLPIRNKQQVQLPQAKRESTWRSLAEGLTFLRKTQIILAAITLDMFAVLLGGATTLLPIYATDILHVGPEGLGWLRAAPSIGAVCVALTIAHRPPFKRAGPTLLMAVIGFGLATVIFGLSHSFWLSLLMLLLLGGLDNISVVIRSTLLLIRTPDAMRGRVASVNTIFVGASNQLGGFESGLLAQFFGPVLSVVGGGVGTVLVVIAVAFLFPELRRLSTLRATEH